MESKTVFFEADTFINTKKNSKISKKCVLKGTKNLRVDTKNIISKGAILRGDLGEIYISSNVIVKENAVLKPGIAK